MRGAFLQLGGSIGHWWQRVFGCWVEGRVLDTVPEAPEGEPEFWGYEVGERRRKLFQREKRPAPEGKIIDTSEGGANYRYVIGQHFSL